MTSIIQTIETEIQDDVKKVEDFFTGTVEPDVANFFKAAYDLVSRNGGTLLLKAAADVVPNIATGQWGAAVIQVIADAKSAGAELLAEEESLAASTALQIAQAAGAALKASSPEPSAEASTAPKAVTALSPNGEANAAT